MNKRKSTLGTYLLNDEFLLLSHLLKRPSMLISNTDFIKWITGRYFIFRNLGIRFPLLNYLIMRHKVFLKHLLLKKFNILSPKIDYYAKQDILKIINLHPYIFPVVAGYSLEKDKVLDATSLKEGAVRTSNIFFHPEVHLINGQILSDNQIFSKDTLEKDESSVIPDSLFFHPEVHLSKNISVFPLITKQIFSKGQILPEDTSEKDEVLKGTSFNKDTVRTSNIFSRPGIYFSKYILNSPIINKQIFSNNKRVTYLSSKSESLKDRNRLISAYVNQSEQFSPGTDFISRKSDIVTERYDSFMTFKQAAKENAKYTIKKDATRTLHYIKPLRVALNDLKKTVEVIEKKVAESKSFAGKSGTDNSSFGNRISDISNKENNNISHLTEQVYQMLERKIRIERERKGLY